MTPPRPNDADPTSEAALVVTPDDLNPAARVAFVPDALPPGERLARRRADVDAKQAAVARLAADLGAEAAVLLQPAHLSWFTSGLNARGLLADTERPGVYVTARGRWLLCSNVDTQRLFDEELDGLGFQVKEWSWLAGRAALLGELLGSRKIAVDRPYPNLPVLTDRLRGELRQLTPYDRYRYQQLGRLTAHALEATARTIGPGVREEEVAGQIAHRLFHHGAEVTAVSVTADGRGAKYRRAGFTVIPVVGTCVLQATACRDGLYCTASRAVSFGPPDDAFRADYDAAARLAAVYWSMSRPDETVGSAMEAGSWLLANSSYEFEWRHSQVGFGTGWFPAEELRRLGQDDRLAPNQPVVWQARTGAAAAVDTVLVTDAGPVPVTPPGGAWPFKRMRLKDKSYDVPDLLVREV